ncbi:hypothetical protein H5410_046304 [Solanum commersonii]|uniref:Uncharacterized protein n=1 Tax=Solanum commersonii TaxID=4109 RepID=A0A9J5XFA3_SOLCO|nr:hypothetical protein H5410_046304 [Solanum commersonii]
MQEKHNEDTQEHNSKERTTTARTQNRPTADHNQKTQVKQLGNKEHNKSTGIDSMLPSPLYPTSSYFDDNAEAEGGRNGECQENHTNMQEGVTKEGNLTHVRHEGTHGNHNTRPTAPATTMRQQQSTEQQQLQHQRQLETGNNREKQQEEAQYMTPPTNVPRDKRGEKCQMNKGPIVDEYAVDNSEDEVDMDNQSLKDPNEDDEASELLIRGDYNVITNIEEKLGGVPYNMRKSLEFIVVIEACGLLDLGFSGQKYTWSNKRCIHHRIWKRLDRAMVNDSWLEKMPQTTITHLSSIGSDHCPLLLEMVAREEEHTKYFKFLNCWAEHPNFLDMVKSCWEREVEGNSMWRFHQKLKRLSNTLTTWSRREFGDILMKVREYKEKVRTAEEKLIQEQTNSNRAALHELNAEYINFLKLEDSILK